LGNRFHSKLLVDEVEFAHNPHLGNFMKRKKTSEDAEPLPKTHDALVRLNFSDLAQVRDLFQHYLPRKWQGALDLHLLKAASIQLVRRNLRSLMPDFLFEIPYSNRDDSALVSLQIEHQSSPDFSLPIRLAQSRIEIWHQWLRQNPGKALPIVLSLVFYTGGQAYPYSLRLQDMLADPCGLFAEQFSALLIDLSQIPDEELQELKRSSSWLRLMKHIYDHRLSSAQFAEILADLNHHPYARKRAEPVPEPGSAGIFSVPAQRAGLRRAGSTMVPGSCHPGRSVGHDRRRKAGTKRPHGRPNGRRTNRHAKR
jgi:predicted transposase YdaD